MTLLRHYSLYLQVGRGYWTSRGSDRDTIQKRCCGMSRTFRLASGWTQVVNVKGTNCSWEMSLHRSLHFGRWRRCVGWRVKPAIQHADDWKTACVGSLSERAIVSPFFLERRRRWIQSLYSSLDTRSYLRKDCSQARSMAGQSVMDSNRMFRRSYTWVPRL